MLFSHPLIVLCDILIIEVVSVKKVVMNYTMNLIKKNGNYDEDQLAVIKYGLEGIYLTITKLIIILFLAYFLNIIREVIIFLIIYNIIRMPSFGLHATKSWICLLSSTIIFIGFPIVCNYIYMSNDIKVILGLILILFIYKNSPADTHKRPIVNHKRRLFFKYCSTFIAIIFVYCSILINDNFLSNCFIFTLLVQCFVTAPTIYKLFKLPYNNYLTYLANDI